MARPFYPHEVDDPDLDWLVSNFLYERRDYFPIETESLPIVLLPICERCYNATGNRTPTDFDTYERAKEK